MEFQFRAGDECSGHPPPSTDAAATATSAEAGIWERLLREDEEKLAELEAEVRLRRELMEKRIPLLRSGLGRSAGACALGSGTTPAPSGTRMEDLEARSKENASVALPAKRKNPDVAVVSTASMSTRSNKQKLDWSCTLCGITATSEKGLQDHLKGKMHMKTAARLGQPTAEIAHEDDDEAQSKANASVALPVKRKNPDIAAVSTASMSTRSNKPKLDLSCTVCGITATSEKALQDHLKGNIHMKKAAWLAQPTAEAAHVDDEEAQSKANASVDLPVKRKNPDVAVAFTASMSTRSNKQKLALSCTVCSIMATSEKGLQDHLKGKMHMKKAARLAQPTAEAAHETDDEVPSKANVPTDASILSAAESGKKHKLDLTCTVCAIPLTSEKAMEIHLKGNAHRKKADAVLVPEEGHYTPKKIHLMTNDKRICEVVQMNGSVFCEVCNVSTPDNVTMMCHLQGSKHISKARQKAATPPTTATITAAIVDGDPQTVAVRINSMPHTVRRVGGSLLCELCDVKVPSGSEGVMRSHLSGRMHTNKLKAVTPVDMGAAEKAEIITKDVALTTNVHIMETPGQEVKKDDGADSIDGSELVEEKAKDASLAASTTSCTQGNDCMEKPGVGACVLADEPATVGCPTGTVVEKKADSEGNTSRVQEMEAVETDGITMVPADQQVKIQVEGKVFVVLRQPDGRLSCRLCGVHNCDKYDMIKHLCIHLNKVRLVEQRSK